MLKNLFYAFALATLTSVGSYADEIAPGTEPVIIPQDQEQLACGKCKKKNREDRLLSRSDDENDSDSDETQTLAQSEDENDANDDEKLALSDDEDTSDETNEGSLLASDDEGTDQDESAPETLLASDEGDSTDAQDDASESKKSILVA